VEQERGVGLVTGGGIWLRPALSLRKYDIARPALRGRREQASKGGAVSSMYFHWASYHEETNG